VLSYDPSVLKTAVILSDRPEVGIDANRAESRLPSVVWLRVTVVDVGVVRCALESSAITTLLGKRAPTWGDLEAVWQKLAGVIERKIRNAEFEVGHRHRDRLPVVSVTSTDVRHEAQKPFEWHGEADAARAQSVAERPI
jgi:hypothetical protein